ncbi:SDR family NAD(P)-dependent oxidoreductase [Mycolicibacterium neoaurum]|uniref:SDR family NAD(P)-dependent oxidoreductase n=1 Tax=Mycolicibacterium neoaurum TaxID=1795 RepID=UPI00248BABB2|nr:SDR family NAD(P)-dependent oxidoreductase [Mycolicibacterium neoaurum]MDO3401426.1 SDR family NAD(P)-dependent oxidoreductase [Mycolicibacterium neoaurum]WBP93284.1 SDR family NAD(P)-dependent oxidoreductase [Mycolicibacterium neoaurum]WBS07041.1 SDR family NAD(P)-dependent oxidoreductase [Mycolicibacterium neoaurum]
MIGNLFGRPRRTADAKAVVTGAGSGIGRAFALELARRGGEVICADIDLDRAAETVTLIDSLGSGTGHAVQCDVSDRSAIEQLAKQAEDIFGGAPTCVINNAGVGIGGKPVGDIGFDDWDWALGINLWGVIYGCEVFTPILRRAGRGGIINVASAAGFAAAPSMAAYNVSKAGVMSLSETLAAELSGTDIAVTVLCPTFVKTNVFTDGRITPGSMNLSQQLARWTGVSAEGVATRTLDAHDRGNLYVVPQLDAKVVWHLKRHVPALYAHGAGLLGRLLPSN